MSVSAAAVMSPPITTMARGRWISEPGPVANSSGMNTATSEAVIETMVKPGRLDWAGVAQRMSHTPARIAGLSGQGRPVAVGEPANLVLVDPSARAVVDRDASASKSRNNPYHGRDLPDPVVATVWAGKVTHRR
mgnify:CR=1 FL=1